MSNFNVNISIEDVLNQKEQETVKFKPKTVFNEKNYLQARLANGEKTKEMTIRLLPFNQQETIPFHKVHMHTVRVNKEVSPSGWKTFPCPVKNHLGDKCPFCEMSELAKEEKKNTTSEAEKKKYNEIEFNNSAKEMWIVRCIERGHEEDGVKFWLFPHSKKQQGVYDKINNIATTRYKKGLAQGRVNNIFDLNEGKDLVLTLSKDSMDKTQINIADDDTYTPLTTDFEKGVAWINDEKKWEEVYTVKSYDYMSIIVEGGVPVFSKEKNMFVDRDEAKKESDAAIDANLDRVTMDFSKAPQEEAQGIFNQSTNNSSTFDIDDLPF
jgi:hypothetical protein